MYVDFWLVVSTKEFLLKDLRKRFAFLGESTATIFLFSVGEEMPETAKRMQKIHSHPHIHPRPHIIPVHRIPLPKLQIPPTIRREPD